MYVDAHLHGTKVLVRETAGAGARVQVLAEGVLYVHATPSLLCSTASHPSRSSCPSHGAAGTAGGEGGGVTAEGRAGMAGKADYSMNQSSYQWLLWIVTQEGLRLCALGWAADARGQDDAAVTEHVLNTLGQAVCVRAFACLCTHARTQTRARAHTHTHQVRQHDLGGE